MPIDIVPFTTEWELAARRFNRRMREANAPSDFGLPERAGALKAGPVHGQHFVAVEGEEVRGGIFILEHQAYLNGGEVAGRNARRETVLNLQSPLSEAIFDPRYAMVSIQLIRFALKRSPYAYVVGMGSARNPLPRLLKASGWTVRPVPFFFHILRPSRALTQLKPLQRTGVLKIAARLMAYTGTGTVALRLLQRQRASAAGFRAELVEETSTDPQVDDAIWAAMEGRISFGVVRDSATLAGFLPPQVERYRAHRGAECRGWYSMMVSSMRDHSYFGDLRVATLVDVIGSESSDLEALAVLAVQHARTAGCDLVVSNQLRADAGEALRRAGFLGYSSNFLLASSKLLSSVMRDETSLVSRQDGDGLVNLRGAKPNAADD